MLRVMGSVWALLLGMFLLMVGNGPLQGSLIGIRGAIEEFLDHRARGHHFGLLRRVSLWLAHGTCNDPSRRSRQGICGPWLVSSRRC